MAGTRWAAQLAFAIPALLLLAPVALWVGPLGPFLHRHHPLPPAARRRALEARLREGAWPSNHHHQYDDNGCARGSIVPPPDRALELALLTEPAAVDGEPEPNPHHDAGMCEWDWPWLRAQLEPALAQLRPLVRLDPVTSRLVPSAHVLPPGLAAAAGAGAHAPSIIPTSALGTLGAHLDEAVLGPPSSLPPGHAAETEGRAPLRLVVACPAPGRGRHGGTAAAAASFVEDGLGGSSGSGDAAAAASTAVTIDGWGGVLLLGPGHEATGAAGSRMALLSEAAHAEVVGFVVAALRRWVLGEAAEGPPAVGEEGKRGPLLALTAAELGALMTRAAKARAWEALRRVRAELTAALEQNAALQLELNGRELQHSTLRRDLLAAKAAAAKQEGLAALQREAETRLRDKERRLEALEGQVRTLAAERDHLRDKLEETWSRIAAGTLELPPLAPQPAPHPAAAGMRSGSVGGRSTRRLVIPGEEEGGGAAGAAASGRRMAPAAAVDASDLGLGEDLVYLKSRLLELRKDLREERMLHKRVEQEHEEMLEVLGTHDLSGGGASASASASYDEPPLQSHQQHYYHQQEQQQEQQFHHHHHHAYPYAQQYQQQQQQQYGHPASSSGEHGGYPQPGLV